MSLGFHNQIDTQMRSGSCVKEPDFCHALAVGQTGCGKTTGFILPHLKDRIERGHGVLMFDYKGKEHRNLKVLAQEAGVLDRVCELGKPWGMRINLLEMLGENGLMDLMGELGSTGNGDQFWTEAANALTKDVYHVLLHGYRLALTGACDPSSYQPTAPTLKTLYGALASISSLQSTLERYEMTAVMALVAIEARRNEGEDTQKLVQALKACAVIKNTLDSLTPYRDERLQKEERTSSGYLGVLMCANSVLRRFSTYGFINDPDGEDLVRRLSGGALVTVDTQMLGEAMLHPLMTSVVARLVKRTSLVEAGSAVSIVADEAQRVLSGGIDMGEDVLRESRVELLLATQDIGQLTGALGSDKARSLLSNIKYQLFFRGQPFGWAGYQNLQTEQLDSFVCLEPGEKPLPMRVEPVFISEGDRIYAQWLFQESNPMLKTLIEGQKPALLHYDEDLFERSGEIQAWVLTQDKRELTKEHYQVDALIALTDDEEFGDMLALLDEMATAPCPTPGRERADFSASRG